MTEPLINFFVPGEARAWSRAGISRSGRIYKKPQIRQWQKKIKDYSLPHLPDQPIDTTLIFCCVVHVKRSKNIPQSRRHATTRQDIDNLAKGAMDAMQGFIYTNDNRISALLAFKVYSQIEGIRIMALPISDDFDLFDTSRAVIEVAKESTLI